MVPTVVAPVAMPVSPPPKKSKKSKIAGFLTRDDDSGKVVLAKRRYNCRYNLTYDD